MSISGLKKASWYNPDTGTVVQADMIAEDGEFYTRAIEDPDDETATGEPPYAGDESYCQLMVFDMSLLSQLKAWEENDTRISMVAAGVQQNIQWYERDLVSAKPVYPVAAGRRNHINVTMERTGHGAHDIYGHVNLLSHLGTTADPWTDADGDNIADGYRLQDGMQAKNFGTINGNEKVQSVNTDKDFAELYTEIFFPIAGVNIKTSIEITQLHNDGSQQIAVEILGPNGSSLSFTSKSYSSTGRKSLAKKIPVGVYKIKPFLIATGSKVNSLDDLHGRYPALRVDGSDQYVSY